MCCARVCVCVCVCVQLSFVTLMLISGFAASTATQRSVTATYCSYCLWLHNNLHLTPVNSVTVDLISHSGMEFGAFGNRLVCVCAHTTI